MAISRWKLLGISLSCLLVLVDCWSTSITEHCTTRYRKAPATTTTVTTTRYVEHVSKTTSTATEAVPLTTTTTTLSGTRYIDIYTATMTDYYTEYDYEYDEIFSSTILSFSTTYTSTSGLTTITMQTPSGFTPAASLYPSVERVVDAKTGTNLHVVCHEKYILATTVTTTLRASSIVTSTDSSEIITDYSYAISTDTVSVSGTEVVETVTSVVKTVSYTEEQVRYTTTTSSTTTIVPTATYYAACATNNVIDSIGGQYLSRYYTSQDALNIESPDPYSCCVECFNHVNCTGMVYVPYADDYDPPYTEMSCFLFIVLVGVYCNGSAPGGWEYWTGADSPYISIANGPCGQGVLMD